MGDILYPQESHRIIGLCMEVHRELGMGFREAVYKEALEIEFISNNIPFEREKLFRIEYKGKILQHKYPADFIVYGKIVLEIKAVSYIIDTFLLQTINYLKASGLQLGIIANFGRRSLDFKRVVF